MELERRPLGAIESDWARSSISDYTEHVLPALGGWLDAGLRAAIVTLVGIEGGAPRPLGAQMAVAEDGQAVGYISGGCLEAAIVAEAQTVIAEGRNRLVRYGAGSPYIDVRLPCGSGLDVYIDQTLPQRHSKEMLRLWQARQPFLVESDLDTGRSHLLPVLSPGKAKPKSERDGSRFTRIYWPQLRLVMAGAGPAAACLATLAGEVGWQVSLFTPDVEALGLPPSACVSIEEFRHHRPPETVGGDAWTAGATLFHDHEWEIPFLVALLRSDCFYIGAVGSRRVHEERLRLLKDKGFSGEQLSRIHGPAGLIGQAKSPSSLAVSMLAEIMAVARDMDYTP